MLKSAIKSAIRSFGFEISRPVEIQKHLDIGSNFYENAFFSILDNLRGRRTSGQDWRLEYEFLRQCINELDRSRAQLFQDCFAATIASNKKVGFFVEFGATNGVDLSNTYYLEKHLGWSGLLAEPSKFWHEELFKNRSCTIVDKCVWHASGLELLFNETPIKELSTLDAFSNSDTHSVERAGGVKYTVETISLTDLLRQNHAPKQIDYLSVDTEGSEYDILAEFCFEEYSIASLSVEHNYSPRRQDLYELLTKKGFKRVLEQYSLWDDWYIAA